MFIINTFLYVLVLALSQLILVSGEGTNIQCSSAPMFPVDDWESAGDTTEARRIMKDASMVKGASKSLRLWRSVAFMPMTTWRGGTASNFDHCLNVSDVAVSVRDDFIDEFAQYQTPEMYGHPRYCPERASTIHAQPQYSGHASTSLFTEAAPWHPIMDESYTGTTGTGMWYFKGLYYIPSPGRIGARAGNPTLPFLSIKDPFQPEALHLTSGELNYVRDLPLTDSYDTFSKTNDNCVSYRAGGTLDKAHGIWHNCTGVVGGSRTAFANFVGSGLVANKMKLGAASPSLTSCNAASNCSLPLIVGYTGIAPSILNMMSPVYQSYNVRITNLHCPATSQGDADLQGYQDLQAFARYCPICSGDRNWHNRKNVANFDEGPNIISEDPCNPWSMTVTVAYPTTVDTSTFDVNSYNVSSQLDINSTCTRSNMTTSDCDVLKSEIDKRYKSDNHRMNGFSHANTHPILDNSLGQMAGRWDRLTARGRHLHYPAENWGASFEPTRTLVGHGSEADKQR